MASESVTRNTTASAISAPITNTTPDNRSADFVARPPRIPHPTQSNTDSVTLSDVSLIGRGEAADPHHALIRASFREDLIIALIADLGSPAGAWNPR
jgi:hypothetical protein